MVDLGLIILLAGFPFSVEVAAVARKPVISLGDSVGIEHRDYLEQILGAQHTAILVISN